MATQLSAVVKNELATRAQETSVRELQDRGVDRIRVIRSSQILELIGAAVDRAIRERGLDSTDETRSGLMSQSEEIFRGLMREELGALRQDGEEHARELLRRSERAEGELHDLRQMLVDRDQEVQQWRAKAAELDAEVRVLHQRQESGSSEGLLEELRALRSEIASHKSLGSRGASDDGVEPEPSADLSALFTAQEDLDSNLGAVEAKVRKGADVAEALKKMKSLRTRSS